MLMLVHPRPEGQGGGTDPPKRRKGLRAPAMVLTADEARHFRAACRNIARAYGGMPVLAMVVGVSTSTLHQALSRRRRPSGVLVIRVAKAGGVSVESILSGKLTAAGACSTCGHKAGDGRLVAEGAR